MYGKLDFKNLNWGIIVATNYAQMFESRGQIYYLLFNFNFSSNGTN